MPQHHNKKDKDKGKHMVNYMEELEAELLSMPGYKEVNGRYLVPVQIWSKPV